MIRSFVTFVLFLYACAAHAEARRPIMWLEDLAYLQNASPENLEEQRQRILQIRSEFDTWLKLHPASGIQLPPAPPEPWSFEETRNQVALVFQVVESILKEDPNRPFHLGVTEIVVSATMSPLSPMADSIDQTDIIKRHALTAAAALDYLPGVSIEHIAANRNEAGIRVRGFSTRGQVPLYIDGIPVYVPYDGYVDFNRFLTSDIAEVQVSKGFSSPLLGPNALGGSINLVTKQPEKKAEAEGLIGTGSGRTFLSSMRLGSRWRHFYLQGSFDWLQRKYTPLSADFPLNQHQSTYRRDQSDSRDQKYSGRIAWTPKGRNEYVFSYINQKAEKSVPLYAGPNPDAVFNNFWRWPKWNKTSYYFLSDTGIGEVSSIIVRAYYDQFKNTIDMFDDATYTSMNKSTSQHSAYDESSGGTSAEFTTRMIPGHTLGASFFLKEDTHREYGIFPGRSPYPLITPELIDRARQVSIGVQDAIVVTPQVRATVGLSLDRMKGLQAQTYDRTMTGLLPVRCIAAPENESFSGCTADVWNINPQASFSYSFTQSDTLFGSFADRGRFPLLKESYSYSLGRGLPNPDLRPERSRNWNIGYSRAFAARTLAQLDVFRSDIRDAIQPVYIKDPGSLCSNTGALAGYCRQNVNIAKEIHEGAEFNLRSTPISRLTLDASYSYLNRTLAYDFARLPSVSQVNTSIQILPALPKNKLIAGVTVQLPQQALAMVNARYEGGITLQDTTYNPAGRPIGESFGTLDIGTVIPVGNRATVHMGVKNLFDRNYYYTAGYPEAGRTWFFNLRYRY